MTRYLTSPEVVVRFPYLIQCATIRNCHDNVKLSDAVSFDYMGSSEFEWGALPASFRRIESTFSEFNERREPQIQKKGKELIVYGVFSDEDWEVYRGYLQVLRANRGRTKEYTNFVESDKESKTDFWWDIDNDVMFGFNPPFMRLLKGRLQASFEYMNKKI